MKLIQKKNSNEIVSEHIFVLLCINFKNWINHIAYWVIMNCYVIERSLSFLNIEKRVLVLEDCIG